MNTDLPSYSLEDVSKSESLQVLHKLMLTKGELADEETSWVQVTKSVASVATFIGKVICAITEGKIVKEDFGEGGSSLTELSQFCSGRVIGLLRGEKDEVVGLPAKPEPAGKYNSIRWVGDRTLQIFIHKPGWVQKLEVQVPENVTRESVQQAVSDHTFLESLGSEGFVAGGAQTPGGVYKFVRQLRCKNNEGKDTTIAVWVGHHTNPHKPGAEFGSGGSFYTDDRLLTPALAASRLHA